jgi:hypothetical protein
MGWFSSADGKAAMARTEDLRSKGWRGGIDRNGDAVMSRTDKHGKPLPLFEGGTGHGTPDEERGGFLRRFGGRS